MMIRRSGLVYVLLLLVWALVMAWQLAEHHWVRQSARAALINRSHDITDTLGLVIRSQRFRGVVFQERVESALKELVKSGELSSVELLNAAGEIVVSAGSPIGVEPKVMMRTGELWRGNRVAIFNPVDLGASPAAVGETNRPTIVLPRRDSTNGAPGEGRPRFGPREEPASARPGTNPPRTDWPPPPPPDQPGRTNRPRGGPPFRMDPKEFQSLLEHRGLHGLVLAMSTDAYRRACVQDLWMRGIIGCFATISVFGLGLAWRNVAKSSDLQIRLLRASELNLHLKEMNVAAAGLAHETRNPLNIIRGLAQVISREGGAPVEVRKRSKEIIEETDRVTAQLNEFINYSRPREVRPAPVNLDSIVAEVTRALKYDTEEKNISLRTRMEPLRVQADEQLLRQALFNLLLNAVQAVEAGGEIEVRARKTSASEAVLEVADNGPGVSLENRPEIFKPYFTTHQKGTGLGLAMVQQIVLAHSWEIECLSNEPKGALFRITHMILSP